MGIVLVVLHLLASAVLVGVVLLQSGRGAEMGAAFGGSSQTLFGGRGAATFLSKLTVGAAVTFMLTSLSLSVLSRERSIASSLMDINRESAEEVTEASDTREESDADSVATEPLPSSESTADIPEEQAGAAEAPPQPPSSENGGKGP